MQQPPNNPNEGWQPQQQQPLPGQWQQPPVIPSPPVQQPPKKKRNPWLIVGIVVGALILCGAIGSAFSRGSSSTTTTITATDTPIATATPVSTAARISVIPTSKPASVPKWTVTHTFTGSGNKKTGIFNVPDDWKIVWKCNQSDIASHYGLYNLELDVNNSDSSPLDAGALNELCKSSNVSGETEEHQSGSVYLNITSEAGWTIQVQELK